MITYELALLIGAVLLLAYIVYAMIAKRNKKRMIVTCLFIIYLVGVAIVTLFPIVYSDPVAYTDAIKWYNFIPFKTAISAFQNGITTTAVAQIIGNIVLSVPFGTFVLILFRIPQWWKKALIALIFPVLIECTQLIIGIVIGNMYRNIDVDDILFNMLGVFLGYAIYTVIPQRIKQL